MIRYWRATTAPIIWASIFWKIAQEEVAHLISIVDGKQLDWTAFSAAWYAGVRRTVLGDSARDDRDLTDKLYRLRANSNWVFLRPVNRRLREQYRERLDVYLVRAERGSLAELAASMPL
jgi:hypothetical protein